MARGSEGTPVVVLPETGLTQAGDIHSRWGWVEPSVWTRRMLTALEQGVKGGVWFSLIDKVHKLDNLCSAFREVAANHGSAGVDQVTVEHFRLHLEENLNTLRAQLRQDRYQPQAARRVYLPKPGSTEKRPLGIPAVRDRVVEAALRHVLEPIFEREFASCSYGFRPGRDAKEALRELDRLLRSGYLWVVDADLQRYFDSISHDRLMALVRERVADGRVLHLLEQLLKRGVLEGGQVIEPETGTPQGGVISPLLANIFLNPLDHLLTRHGYRLIRYADDLVIVCRTRMEAEAALTVLRDWTVSVSLQLHPSKTRLVDMNQAGAGFDFLGYHFERTRRRGRLSRWPRQKSLRKYKDAIRVHTRRANGHSLPDIIAAVNRVSRGWFAYFKHSNAYTFSRLDRWLRQRLRAILRCRRKRKHRAGGADFQRWPNAFFAARGLFSLTAAHAAACQSV